MIEREFTALDNDFITVWARQLKSGFYCDVKSDIWNLARLGQVNAMQIWYDHNSVGEDLVIDSNVKFYENETDLNSLYLLGNFEKAKADQSLKYMELSQEFQTIEYGLKFGRGFRFEKYHRRPQIWAEIYNIPFAGYFTSAIYSGFDELEQEDNPLIAETLCEILNGVADWLYEDSDKNELVQKCCALSDIAVRDMCKEFGILQGQTIEDKTKEDPQLAFQLAKCIKFFHSNHKSLVEQADIIIDCLANRELEFKPAWQIER